jgi:hypothetical protein
VLLTQASDWQVAESIPAVGETMAVTPKFRPETVIVSPPVTAAFVFRKAVATGASNVKYLVAL